MKWNFEAQGSKEQMKKFVDDQLYVARKVPAPVKPGQPTAVEKTPSDSVAHLKALEQHGVNPHKDDPGKLDMPPATVGGELLTHDTPKVVVDLLKQAIDGINLKPDHEDPKMTWAVKVKSDGMADEHFVSCRYEVSRVATGK